MDGTAEYLVYNLFVGQIGDPDILCSSDVIQQHCVSFWSATLMNMNREEH